MRTILLIFLLALSRPEAKVPDVAREQQFTYYYYAAVDAWQAQRYEEAMAGLIFCEQLNDQDAKVKEMLGILYEAMKQYQTAYRYFKRAYELAPDECWERYMMAERARCIEANDVRGALRCQDVIDAHKGKDAYSAFLRLRIGELKRLPWRKLVPLYEEMLSYDPGHASTLNNYAYGLATHKGDMVRAEQMSREAIRREPNNATYLDTYAWILYLKGERQLAQFYIRKALENAGEADRPVIEQHKREIEK